MCCSITLVTIQQSCLKSGSSAVPVACFLIHAPSSCRSGGEGNEVSRDGWGDRARERKKRRMEEQDSAGSLIPPVVRSSALLMCWGSHIVAEILSLSRHVLCACACLRVCLCACLLCVCVLVCCGRTSPTRVLPVNTSISQGAQSVTMLSLLRWPHGMGVLTHTHKHSHTHFLTDLWEEVIVCVWRALCCGEDSPGSLILSKFQLAAWLWFAFVSLHYEVRSTPK